MFETSANSISYRQSLGQDFDRDIRNLAQGIWGAPRDWLDADGLVLSPKADRTDTKISLANRGDEIILTVTETYRTLESPEVKRNFQWNAERDLFEEVE